MTTCIFVESSTKTPARMQRMVCFVVAYLDDEGNEIKDSTGTPITRIGIGQRTGTYSVVTLIGLICALKSAKLRGEICIHSQNSYVLNMIRTNLKEWSENGYTKRDGKPLQAQCLWEKVGSVLEEKEYSVQIGHHPYYRWMMEQMKDETERREKCS